MEQFLPHSPWKEPSLLTPWFHISSLQNSETINFCCLKHPASGTLFWQPQEINTLYQLVEVLYNRTLLKDLSRMDVRFWQMPVLYLLHWAYGFLYILLICLIVLTDFQLLTKHCIPRINVTGRDVFFFLYIIELNLLKLCLLGVWYVLQFLISSTLIGTAGKKFLNQKYFCIVEMLLICAHVRSCTLTERIRRCVNLVILSLSITCSEPQGNQWDPDEQVMYFTPAKNFSLLPSFIMCYYIICLIVV